MRIKNRWFCTKVYPNCFIGTEAVVWFSRIYKLTIEDATRLGQCLIDEQWIHHVKDEHAFEDAHLFIDFIGMRMKNGLSFSIDLYLNHAPYYARDTPS